MGDKLKQFGRGQGIYADHVASLIAPGHDVAVFQADQIQPAAITDWTDQELALLVDEGRRQVDRQRSDLEHIRARAQWLFALGVASLAALGGGFVAQKPSLGLGAPWIIGMLILVYGIGGAAAILTVKADFKMIHTAVLSQVPRPVNKSLAESYSRMMAVGENTVATRLTVFRQAVVFCLVGGYVGLLAALLAS